MHDLITKLLRPDFGVPGHLTTGQGGLTPAQAYGVEVPPSPALADLEARRTALDEVVRNSQEGSQSLNSLVANTDPAKLAEAVAEVASKFATKQFIQTQSAAAFQMLLTQKTELAKAPEPWNWNRKQLDKQIKGSVKQLKDAAAVLGESLISVESNDPNEISVTATGNANKSIRELASLSRFLPKDNHRALLDSAQVASVYAASTGSQPENPEEAREVAETVKQLAHKSVGILLAALVVNALPGYELSVSGDWFEVQSRAELLNDAAKVESVGEPNLYISMGRDGDTVHGGGANLPTL